MYNKEKRAISDKLYREANKERVKERKKKYYENNKEKIKAAHKLYSENNKEYIAEHNKKYREENKDELIKYHKKYREEHEKELIAWREENKDYLRGKAKEWYWNNRERSLGNSANYKSGHMAERKEYDMSEERKLKRINKQLMTLYGITLEDRQRMFEEQNGCCAICGTHQSNLEKGLYVDHDHETGVVRALLCFMCNIGLGGFKDDPELMKKGIGYVQKYK